MARKLAKRVIALASSGGVAALGFAIAVIIHFAQNRTGIETLGPNRYGVEGHSWILLAVGELCLWSAAIAAGLFLPARLLLDRFRMTGLAMHVAAFGAAPALMSILLDAETLAADLLICGAVAGFVFWLIRRPDRDAPPTQARSTP